MAKISMKPRVCSNTFASVGATHVDRTLIDIDDEKRAFKAEQSVVRLKTSLPKPFPGAAKQRDSIIIRLVNDKCISCSLTTCLRQPRNI